MEIRRLGQSELLAALHLTWEVFADEIAPAISPEGVASFQKFIKYDYISQVWQRGNLIFLAHTRRGTLRHAGLEAGRPHRPLLCEEAVSGSGCGADVIWGRLPLLRRAASRGPDDGECRAGSG